jgi:hypothetical protein
MSDDVKRYNPMLCGTQDEDWVEMEEASTGEWVRWKDYKRLLTEVEDLREYRDDMQRAFQLKRGVRR